MVAVRNALISVSNKTGIVELCKDLVDLDINIISTGGTAKLLASNNIDVVEISDYTGFPEMMDGRLKTLHPKIHGGLLGRRGIDDAVMDEFNIEKIDLVIVNLYPFEQTVSKEKCSFEEAIENIDIGGPTMLRSAAKNHAAVTVVVDVNDYKEVLKELRENNSCICDKTRFRLAQKVFAHTANYDANISNYLGALTEDKEPVDYPLTYSMQFKKHQELRYGENPHQTAAFYIEPYPPTGTLANARQLQGKALSYNNIVDADAALECVFSFPNTSCVIVKHANPCGVATADTLYNAYDLAYKTDPTSAFGGVIAFNKKLDAQTAETIIERQFVEIIIAPEFDEEVTEIVSSKAGVRLLECGYRQGLIKQINLKRVSGGLLAQDNDAGIITKDKLNIVTKRKPTGTELDDMMFAWRVVKYVKSNAIVYVKNNQTIGIGAGQMSRVYSARIAAIKANDEGLSLGDSILASDAFFPFRDGIDLAAKAGVKAIIQPGGSMRDKETIAAADEHNIAMAFTGIRHFLH